MAPKKDRSRTKVNHKARDRRVAGFDEIQSRNEGTWVDFHARKKEGSDDEDGSDKESDDDKENVVSFSKDNAKKGGAHIYDAECLSRKVEGVNDENDDGLTRKQREEMVKEKNRLKYEAAHKRGETDEAKADLERLHKIRAEREAAKKKREDDVKAKEDAAAAKSASGSGKEYLSALGGESARTGARGRTVVKKKEACTADQMDAFTDQKKAEKIDPTKATAGSIDACRLAEDDFM